MWCRRTSRTWPRRPAPTSSWSSTPRRRSQRACGRSSCFRVTSPRGERRSTSQVCAWEDARVDQTLDFYATPGRFTVLEDCDFSSDDVREVVGVVQGLLVYDMVARPFYGVDLTPDQAEAIHERDTSRLLEIVRAVDNRPLADARPPVNRVGARCH